MTAEEAKAYGIVDDVVTKNRESRLESKVYSLACFINLYPFID